MKPSIPDLLQLVGVSPSDKAAETWITEAIEAARASFQGAKHRPRPADHNDPLSDVEKSARKLSKAVERLRRRPSAWRAFWHSSVFGLVYLDRVELKEVLSTIEDIAKAADAAKDRRQGRGRETGKQHVVDLAFGFFVRFSPRKASGTPTGTFARFAREFYAAATGVDPDQHGGLDRQIRQVQSRLSVERQRVQRKSGKKTRVSS